MFPGRAFEALGMRQFKWPGFNLPDDLPYQFVEDEYMLAEECGEFLKDPGDFTVRKVIPRISQALEPLATLPPLHWLSSGYSLTLLGMTFAGMPPIIEGWRH